MQAVVLRLLPQLDRLLRQPGLQQRRRVEAEAPLPSARRLEAEALHRSISRVIGSPSSPRTGSSACPRIHLPRVCRVAAVVAAVVETVAAEAQPPHLCPLLQVRNNAESMLPEAACAFPADCTSPGLTITL